jgi:hypothetical protein
MSPLRVSLALSLVLVLRMARLLVPLSIPVLEYLCRAPAVWGEEHHHVFCRFSDPDPDIQFVIRRNSPVLVPRLAVWPCRLVLTCC